MSTFIFMLTPETATAIGERMLTELSSRFPEHEFEFAESEMDDLENAILPILDDEERPGRYTCPEDSEVERVQEAFGRLLADSIEWKAS
ncbi:hypothetical protein [Afipia sp. DC4300-2b1]|uniref:hypothetical protein n=1 Tax=Afipia sp. DC4300-2b1 TaxID=2804672 RepID=UPI003CEBE5CE